MQRIKSQGDFEACMALVEGYGVKVDEDIHAEVLQRMEPLQSVPYSGFMNPVLKAQLDADGNATSVEIEYMNSFDEQMLYYSRNYSFLPEIN